MFARYVVTGVAGQVGAVFGPSEFLAAHDCAKRARADGFEGALFGVSDAGELLPFDVAAKAWRDEFTPAPITAAVPELAVARAKRAP